MFDVARKKDKLIVWGEDNSEKDKQGSMTGQFAKICLCKLSSHTLHVKWGAHPQPFFLGFSMLLSCLAEYIIKCIFGFVFLESL